MKTKRKEVPVKNNPGISKEMLWCDKTNAWRATGKYRAMRRVMVDNRSKKIQSIFNSFEDAKAFRNQDPEKIRNDNVHRNTSEDSRMSFNHLVEKWREIHYQTIEETTRQKYDKLLPSFEYLRKYRVHEIDLDVITALALFWKTSYAKTWRRKSFKKEWQLLGVILRYFRDEEREGRQYIIPPFKKARKITIFTPDSDGEVSYLTADEVGVFLEALKLEKDPQYYYLALAQYFFALRICEATALCRDVIDFEKRVVTIRRSMTWHATTWKAEMKEYTKTKRVGYLPIPDMIVEDLKALVAMGSLDQHLLFVRPSGEPLIRKTVSNAYNRVLKKIGFTHVSGTHFLRKTSATLANEATGDYDAVSQYLGHSSIRVTRRYVGETDAQKRKISGALSDVLRPKNEGPVPQCPAPSGIRKFSLVKSGS